MARGTGRTSAGSYPMDRGGPTRRIGKGGTALLAALLIAGGGAASGCTTTPVTGRRAFNLFALFGPSQEVALGAEAYAQVLSESRPVTSGPQKEMVERVMSRLVAVADDPGYEWEVTLLDDDSTVNAFALPGGKMAVYTGILPVCQGEAGLAVVMGHEIGHVVARHGTQRMTESLGVEVVTTALDLGDYEDLARNGLQLLVGLPFSRANESEADHIGLIYMAQAGYDPREATRFWERMSAGSGGSPPEFLSTHPSHETRVSQLEALMPKALAEWEAARARP